MSEPTSSGQVAAPPGGRLLAVAKRGAEHLLWGRVAVQRRLESRAKGERALPTSVTPTGVLTDAATWRRATDEAKRLRLPLHRDLPKNWDALGAVGAVLELVDDGTRSARVMDAGSARYSPVLPWLRLYGFGAAAGSLIGINLEFGDQVTRDGVVFRYGDVTDTGLPSGHLDAITCMSVIEHGVPLEGFLAESARLLRPGGILCVSTDYDQDPPDTTGKVIYGSQVRIFSPQEIRDLVETADRHGLELVGTLDDATLSHTERPVHWSRVDLDYTFILLTFRKR
ncbi:methyltransferase domain-containing protein [Janibacter anophelis]|uniref:methyltransferase domain-containing protein n=1 Tax=Janibacter anophelis TaxID=319054 RepID=UPI000DEF29E8|nr:methyltransferase domain-containing protein [Janibacter anophelis]